MQAMETIKLLLGGHIGPSYSRRLLVFDGESGEFRVVNLRPRQPHCAVCSGVDSRRIHCIEQVDYALFCGRGPNDKVSYIIIFLSLSSSRQVSCTFHLLMLFFLWSRLVGGDLLMTTLSLFSSVVSEYVLINTKLFSQVDG